LFVDAKEFCLISLIISVMHLQFLLNYIHTIHVFGLLFFGGVLILDYHI